MAVIVGMTGATGAVYGIELLRILKEVGVDRHLVMTKAAALTLKLETDWTLDEVHGLATEVHSVGDIGASISSGSFSTHGMIIAPCSIKTLSGVVNSYEDNLLLRAAGVTLKEGRKLVLMVRETPLHVGQIRLLQLAAEIGATVFPPVPAFYHRPKTIEDIVHQSCARALDQLGLHVDVPRWHGVAEQLRASGSM
jgi:4-hydroxy-3-polyprenylbenzoate decarboxylase